jgi:hypothetical protein
MLKQGIGNTFCYAGRTDLPAGFRAESVGRILKILEDVRPARIGSLQQETQRFGNDLIGIPGFQQSVGAGRQPRLIAQAGGQGLLILLALGDVSSHADVTNQDVLLIADRIDGQIYEIHHPILMSKYNFPPIAVFLRNRLDDFRVRLFIEERGYGLARSFLLRYPHVSQ